MVKFVRELDLQNAKKLIQKAQVEEQKTYKENTGIDDRSPVECSVPPPPILLCRTNRTMVFCPAPFQPVSGQKAHNTVFMLITFLLHLYVCTHVYASTHIQVKTKDPFEEMSC